MLSIHVLNVGHGDSIVLQHEEDGVGSFAVIDSFGRAGEPPSALTKLQELGAARLSFLALTHPHQDHYFGLSDILEAFSGRVGKVFSFPIASDRRRLEALIAQYVKVGRNTAAAREVRFAAAKLVKFLEQAKSVEWEDPTGLLGILAVEGFRGVRFSHVLPPAKVKGALFDGLDNGTYPLESQKPNELSLAIKVDYAGVQVLLGADGVKGIWLSQQRNASLAGANFRSKIVKLPHHGSSIDCSDTVLDAIFDADAGDNLALISADGRSHPSPAVLASLKKRGIKPYCTNLSTSCGGGKVRDMAPVAGLEPSLARFVNSVATDSGGARISPCQGDIAIRIAPDGAVTVDRQYSNLCAYRGDFEALPAALGLKI